MRDDESLRVPDKRVAEVIKTLPTRGKAGIFCPATGDTFRVRRCRDFYSAPNMGLDRPVSLVQRSVVDEHSGGNRDSWYACISGARDHFAAASTLMKTGRRAFGHAAQQ